MPNEIFFFIQVFLCVGFTLIAARMGPYALAALIALNGVLANLFVVKQVTLFGLNVTCSDVFAVGSIIGLNLMQEHFGKEAAKKVIKVSFFAMLFFVLVSQIHLWYAPASQDETHAAFRTILSSTPRLVFASIGVYFLVQRLDVLLFGWLKKIFQDKRLGIRMGISLVLSQFTDTALFTFAGLYGIVASLFDVIVLSFAIKCLVILCSAPLVSLVKKKEEAPS
jgi:queuosine precursor transporter